MNIRIIQQSRQVSGVLMFEKYYCVLVFSVFTLSNAKHGRKYWNRSRGKLAFKGLSGKDYGTHGLN